jgi:hypothetical protein
MPTAFKHTLNTSIGTVPTDVVTIPVDTRATVIGCNLVNVTESIITASVYVIGSDTTVSYYVKDVMIPPDTALKVITQGEKLILSENTGLRVVSNTTDSIDATVSYVEITT